MIKKTSMVPVNYIRDFLSNQLAQIGFYTLEDHRAFSSTHRTPLWRCELIVTDKCNFKCPYCRGIKKQYRGTLSLKEGLEILSFWIINGLKNIRFSGGEPTLNPNLASFVRYCKENTVERIAISTNGSADQSVYLALLEAGVNDFSISLDACCSSIGDSMAGGIKGSWERVVKNIKMLSKLTYVTVGVVLTDDNKETLPEIVSFAHGLGVSDIRVISAAQLDFKVKPPQIDQNILSKMPILNYRINHFKEGRDVRGIKKQDNHRCPLVLDDMVVMRGYHFPCIIYMREGGSPIGGVSTATREQRKKWFQNTNVFNDPICRKNCLDVCIDFNNKHYTKEAHHDA